MSHRFRPSTTVAAVIEHGGKFLLVEEQTPEGLRLNNPAGHLDAGESLLHACVRETLEETAFDFRPEALVGIYLARFVRPLPQGAVQDVTYLRFAFCGTLGEHHPQRALDVGIERTVWLSLDEVRASSAQHRSPLVLQSIEDYRRGQRYPLTLLHTHPSALYDAAGGASA
ncbi:MAG: NUDIX hydrolase [Rhodoferax sp.]